MPPSRGQVKIALVRIYRCLAVALNHGERQEILAKRSFVDALHFALNVEKCANFLA